MTSPDGITWTSRTTGISDAIYDIKWSPELEIAVGVCQSGGKTVYSYDCITWTANDIDGSGSTSW